MKTRKAFGYPWAWMIGAVLLASPAFPQSSTKSVTLVANFDQAGAASSATAVHSADAITDSATFTIDAQPDTPRVLAATLTDGDGSISACTYTVVGTNAAGTVITATTALTGGSGAKTLSPAYNWATVTSASVGVCTGEGGGDTVSLGTTTAVPTLYYIAYGKTRIDSQGVIQRGVYDWYSSTIPVTNGAATTDIVAVTASTAPFAATAPGDILLFNISGGMYERAVATEADTDTITVATGVTLPAAGQNFKYHKVFKGPDTEDGWVNVTEFKSVMWNWILAALTADAHTFLQCRNIINGAGTAAVTVDTDAITAAGTVTSTLDRNTLPYDECRAGFDFDTNDGGGAEDLTIQMTGVSRDER